MLLPPILDEFPEEEKNSEGGGEGGSFSIQKHYIPLWCLEPSQGLSNASLLKQNWMQSGFVMPQVGTAAERKYFQSEYLLNQVKFCFVLSQINSCSENVN